jgi:hypothetical protein
MAILAWVARWLTSFGTFLMSAWSAGLTVVTALITVSGVAQAVWFVLRLALLWAVLAAVLQGLGAPPLSLSGLWSTYKGELGPVATYVAFFTPVDFLLSLIDLYLFALVVLVSMKVVRMFSS